MSWRVWGPWWLSRYNSPTTLQASGLSIKEAELTSAAH